MNVSDLIRNLKHLGITLFVEEGQLKAQDPNGVLTPELTEGIKSNKNKLIRLLSNSVAMSASIIAKDKKVRNIVHKFQQKCAYNPPKKYNGSCLDGRDITYNIVPDAEFKFFITASVKNKSIETI